MTARIVSSRSSGRARSWHVVVVVVGVVVSEHRLALAAELLEEVLLECFSVAVGVELLGAAADELADGGELEDEAGFAFGVGPVGVVEHRDPGAEGGEDLDLDFVVPPAAA